MLLDESASTSPGHENFDGRTDARDSHQVPLGATSHVGKA